jgi:hypothetical protein
MYKDPFRDGANILVLCDCYAPPRVSADGTTSKMTAIETNTRHACAAAMQEAAEEVSSSPSPFLRDRFVASLCSVQAQVVNCLATQSSSHDVHHVLVTFLLALHLQSN